MTPARPGRRQSRVPMLLALLCVFVLALLNWHALTMPIDTSPITSELPPENAPAIAGEDLTASISDAAHPPAFPQTLTRPLFRASRRPPEAEKLKTAAAVRPAASKVPVKLPDNIELVGIMKEGDGPGRALIRSGASPNGEWVTVGHLLGGWRLSRIEAGSVLLEAEGQEERISLFPTKSQ